MVGGAGMTRIWFNKTFSNVRALFDLVRRGDEAGEFCLVCSHTQTEFPGFLSAHESLLEPAGLVGPDYVDFCLDVCRQHRIDAFWPGKEVRRLAAEEARFAAIGVRLLTAAEPDSLALLHDKSRFYQMARDFSVTGPEFIAFSTCEQFEAAYAKLRARHPVLCVKPVDGVNGAGFRVIEEQRGGLEILLQGALYSIHHEGLRQLLAAAGEFAPLLLMEFLDGVEYSVDCVGDGRRLIAHVQRRKSNSGGYGQRIVAVPEIARVVAEMTAAFGLRGLFNAQFREGRDGIRLLEINPRFSGGIGYTGAAGVNLPYLALRGLVHGFPESVPPTVAVGVRVLEETSYSRVEGLV